MSYQAEHGKDGMYLISSPAIEEGMLGASGIVV
jgi:hypothetical protein